MTKHFLLFYEVGPDFVAQRATHRDKHLQQAWEASERGELIMAGAVTNPADRAVLLFQGDSPGMAEHFAKTDPYVVHGLIKEWYVREWVTVVGEAAATPVRPTNV